MFIYAFHVRMVNFMIINTEIFVPWKLVKRRRLRLQRESWIKIHIKCPQTEIHTYVKLT